MDKDQEIALLKNEILLLKEQVSKYTNPARIKKYQENNKEKLQEYRKEYYKKYYQDKKNKD